jgi:E3 ubiquitin-protein ligase RAD18
VLEELVFAFGTVRGKLIEELSRRGQESNEGVEVEVIDLDEENNEGETYNDDIQIIKDVKKRKTGPVGLDSLLTKKPKVINATESQKRETMGECPVCSKKFPLDVLQSSHIDSCLSNPQPQPSTTTAAACIPTSSSSPKLPQQTLTKLPKSDLPSLSTAQLKSKLQSLQLPTGGTRNQMEQRLIEYTTLWNANCDSMRPKDVRVLRRELNRWENVVMRDMEVLKRSKDAGKDGKDAVVRQKGNELSEDGWKELIRSVKERKSKVVDDEETKVAGENKKKKKSENVENEVKRDGTLVEGINVHDDWDDADDDQFFARE